MFAVLQSAATNVAFEYTINVSLFWRMLGPPVDIYSFRNLALPRLVAFIATSVPSFLTGLVVYHALLNRRWGFTALSAVCLIGTGFGIALSTMLRRPEPDAAIAAEEVLPSFFAVYLVCITCAAAYLLEKATSLHQIPSRQR
jgi:hypothetical protein